MITLEVEAGEASESLSSLLQGRTSPDLLLVRPGGRSRGERLNALREVFLGDKSRASSLEQGGWGAEGGEGGTERSPILLLRLSRSSVTLYRSGAGAGFCFAGKGAGAG